MPSEGVAQPWAIRSTLISVTDLERSAAFYRELGDFEEIFRDDGVAILGDLSTGSFVLILRESRSTHAARHGQESLGLRSITFSIGSLDELDRIESVLRAHDFFISRRKMLDDASELLRGRDPDNLPLVFVCYARDVLDVDYYRFVADMAHSLDT
jgi:catechol 2,3-dioxygenase-like lactoylglutathione lyase family enzyme